MIERIADLFTRDYLPSSADKRQVIKDYPKSPSIIDHVVPFFFLFFFTYLPRLIKGA